VTGLGAFSLEGRCAVVTGARSGIGRAIALGLAGAGARVAIWGHADNLGETAEALAGAGRLLRTVEADLGDPELVDRACTELLDEHRIDILVNNAGIIRRGPAADSPRRDWDDVMAVNASAVFQLSQRLARPMLERGSGKVISIASVLSFQGGINVVAYATAKHAVAGLTRALANEWAGRGVQVNAIAPGYIARTTPPRCCGTPSGTRPSSTGSGRPVGRPLGRGRRGRLPRVQRVRLRQRARARGGRRLAGR